MTLQRDDLSVANLISSGLFGDGAAAVMVAGDDCPAPGPRIFAMRSTFYPGTVNLQGDSNVKLHGAFSIHGGTHEVLMSVSSHIAQGKLAANISFAVPYVSWGMKNPSTLFLKVNDTVAIEIHAEGELRSGVAN